MIGFNRRGAAVLLSLGATAGATAAEPPHWAVAIADAPGIEIPGVPPPPALYTGEQTLTDAGPADLGLVLVGDDGEGGSTFTSLWTDRGGSGLHAIARIGDAGASGPGRVGAEAGHVFRWFDTTPDHSADGHLVFGAAAGDPNGPIDSASEGVWVGDGSHNTEIARLDTDGPLGPRLGEGWVFASFDDGQPGEVLVTSLPGGGAVMRSSVRDPGSAENTIALHRYSATGGLAPCAVEDSADPALGSGVDDEPFSTLGYRIDASYGRIRAGASIGAGPSLHSGLWEFCNGTPVAQAVTDTPGVLGPGLLFAGNTFTSISDAISATSADTYFFTGHAQSMGEAMVGVFEHVGGANRPVLIGQPTTWTGVLPYAFDFDSGLQLYGRQGRTLMRAAAINSVDDNDHRVGLWLLARDKPVQPIAFSGSDSAFAPSIGHAWNRFGPIGVLSNGDVVVQAETDTGNGLWRLRPDEAPVQVLSIGDAVEVPTASGTVSAPVTDILTVYAENALPSPGGRDSWYGADGDVLVRVKLAGYPNGTIWIKANVASDHILLDGFD